MTNDCICSNVPRIWRLAGVTRTVRLTVTKDGSPYDFTGLQTVLRIDRDNSDFHYEPQFTVEGDDNNIIVFTWAADKQPLGDYTIEVAVTDGSGNMDRVNWHGATGVRLVEYSNLVKGEDAAGVESDSELGLDGIFTMNGTGMSAYDEWLAEGHTGTPEEFIAWLRQPATDAASAAEAQMSVIQGRADEDHTRAGNDHTRAESDHGTASSDHTRAAGDHTQAGNDHTLAASDHTRAGQDHDTAAEDHRVAGIDHGTAADDHTRAGQDHQTASDDHTQAGSDHTRAGEDHTRAGDDHQTASSDHIRAGEDHTTAGSDHTRAGEDHTQAGNDHTRAEADHGIAADDHTQATADHAVMAGYDTRLTNVEGEVTQLGQKTYEFSDILFRLFRTNSNAENLADFSTYDSSDVITNNVGSDVYTISFNNNIIEATQSAGGNGSFTIDMAKLNLSYNEKYFIAIERRGQKAYKDIEIDKNVTEQSAGSRVGLFSRSESGNYTSIIYTSAPNTSIKFNQFYTENEIEYVIYIYKIVDLVKMVSQQKSNSLVLSYHTMLFEDELGMSANGADFSAYSDEDIIYNTGSLTVSFDKNKIISYELGISGNKYVGISLDGLGLENGVQYTIRVYRTSNLAASGYSINTGTTSSSAGTPVANFTGPEDGSYVTATFTMASGLCFVWRQVYTVSYLEQALYICKEYIIEVKGRYNFANGMSWTPLEESAANVDPANVTVTKVTNGADITKKIAGNVGCIFWLPQLKEGHSYTLTMVCSTLNSAPYISGPTSGAHLYNFTAGTGEDVGTYSLSWSDYHEVSYPMRLWLSLKYNETNHEVRFYITDNNEPLEKDVVKLSAIEGIGENNISAELLNRCDFLQNNPTLYRGLDIVAFNKGICIGDSLTAGSLNTTDEQGSVGPNVPADPTRAYPAKLARLTGINITNAGDGGKTFLGYYNAHQNDDWSGNEFAIIELGRNDVASPPVGYGEWNPVDPEDSFYPMGKSEYGFRQIVAKLKAENKGIKIFVCDNTSIVGNKGVGGLAEGVAQIVANLNDQDVILLEMHKYGRLNTTNAYQAGHLTQYGYYRLAQDYCNYISWYMATHKEEFRFIQFIGTDYVYTKEF